MLECVCNISEGRSLELVDKVASAAESALLDIHTDYHHNRSVLTLAGPDVEQAVREVSKTAISNLDLREHTGAHPRLGVVDVVPFSPLTPGNENFEGAVAAQQRFATWISNEMKVPCFLYGPERSLPFVRQNAFRTLMPDLGPAAPHQTAGSVAVGARPVLVAYNLWLSEPDLKHAQQIAARIRSPSVRALGLQLGDVVQVSCNLIEPETTGPGAVYDAVAAMTGIARAELVGLVPDSVLRNEPRDRWMELDLSEERTIESRLANAGFA